MKSLIIAAFAASAAAQYDPNQAAQYVYYAGAAYCGGAGIESWSCGAACDNSTMVEKATWLQNPSLENYGYVAALSDGSILVSFKGTDPSELQNWLDDLNAIQTAYPGCSGCEVHEGFYDSYLGLAQQMVSAVDSYGGTGATAVLVTGHSLGAAISTIAAFELAAAGYPVTTLINFGEPRVGNPSYASVFEQSFTMGAPAAVRAHVAALSPLQYPSPNSARAKALLDAPVANTRAAVEAHKALRRKFLSPVLDRIRLQGARDNVIANAKAQGSKSTGLRGNAAASHALALAAAVPGPIKASPATYWRVTHWRDPVPHVPLEAMGFLHAPTEVWYNSDSSSYTVCSSSDGEDPNCSDSLDFDISISDHLNYLDIPISDLCSS